MLALACAGPAPARTAPAARAASACAYTALVPAPANLRQVRISALCLLNALRAAHGLPALRANRALVHVAGSQAHAMVGGNWFADVRPDGSTPLGLVAHSPYAPGSSGLAVGQASAWGTGIAATPARILAALAASPPHLEVMLSGEYREVGIGVLPAVPERLGHGAQGATYVIVFGARL